MTATTTDHRTYERVVGRAAGDAPGPTLIVCGGMHGNEPAGIVACRAILARLAASGMPLRGVFVALAGNLQGLAQNRRFLAHDLNRAWTQEYVDRLLSRGPDGDLPEDTEQRAIIRHFEAERGRARGPVVVVDLHTTSSAGPPFTIFSDTLDNRRVASRLGIPMILGLEECIDGTLLDFATKSGVIAFVVEGGQHEDPGSATSLEAALWVTLVTLGIIDRVPDGAPGIERLRSAAGGLPTALEVRYRHPVLPQDGFAMRPGYEGFQPIRRGELLAADRHGEIRALESGRILMPLYQAQGADGFFVIREINAFWLAVSAGARKIGLPRIVPHLPGVARHPERPDWIVVHKRVVRFFRRQVFHLLGYRTREVRPDHIVFARRRRRPIELP